jgi:HlyD family secretion protein
MIGMGTQDQSTNFKVKVTFAEVNTKLRPGMSATVDITTAEREDILAVPFASVVVRNYDLDSLEIARQGKSAETTGNEILAAENDSTKSDSTGKKKDEEREDIRGVFIVRDGVARFTKISTGISGRKDIEVTEGLQQDDSVVSGPYSVLRTLKDGDEVKAIKGEGNGKGTTEGNRES